MSVERYDISQLKHSKESKPQKKTFVLLDKNHLGFAINWDKEIISFFIYKEKRKDIVLETKFMSLYSGEKKFSQELESLISSYYRLTGRDPELPMYTKIELRLPMSHLNFHVNAGTLKKILDKEVIYF